MSQKPEFTDIGDVLSELFTPYVENGEETVPGTLRRQKRLMELAKKLQKMLRDANRYTMGQKVIVSAEMKNLCFAQIQAIAQHRPTVGELS